MIFLLETIYHCHQGQNVFLVCVVGGIEKESPLFVPYINKDIIFVLVN